MNKIQIFNNDVFGEIRTIVVDDEPWFVAADIAKALEYSETSVMLRRLDSDDTSKIAPTKIVGTNSMSRGLTIINESGLYNAIFGSKLPSAKQFKRWVTSEVLPQIRRTGGYMPLSANESYEDIMAKAVLIAQNTIEQKDVLIAKQTLQIQQMQPKVLGYDTFLKSKGYVSLNKVAKYLHKGRNKMMSFLREQGVLFKDDNDNIAYQRFCDAGYFTVNYKVGRDGKFHAVTKVSPKGVEYIKKLYDRVGAA